MHEWGVLFICCQFQYQSIQKKETKKKIQYLDKKITPMNLVNPEYQ